MTDFSQQPRCKWQEVLLDNPPKRRNTVVLRRPPPVATTIPRHNYGVQSCATTTKRQQSGTLATIPQERLHGHSWLYVCISS